MRERDHSDVVVVLKERESVAELAVVDQATDTTNCACELVLGDFAIEELRDIIGVKAWPRELCR